MPYSSDLYKFSGIIQRIDDPEHANAHSVEGIVSFELRTTGRTGCMA